MRAFTEPLTQLQGYEELEQAVQKTEGVILVSGCIDAVKPHIVYSVHNGSGNRIIVTFHEQKAKELLEEYRFLIKTWHIIRRKIFYFISRISVEMF